MSFHARLLSARRHITPDRNCRIPRISFIHAAPIPDRADQPAETIMIDPNFVLLYVDNPATSATFYAELLGKQPIESSPTFAMFALDSGVKLGLWSRHTVEPAALSAE